VTPRPAADAKPSASSGLGSITRAADRVVEVIPGAVVLALAGLGALVLLLIVRSWGIERRRSKALEESYGVTVEALATAIEAKDHTTGGHIERVRSLGLLMAGEIAPRDVSDPQMAFGFLLHDIGKLAVPDALLRAPGRLSEKEWALMRRHPEEGVRMLSEIPFLDRALDVVRHHHERWDGGGYPDGLRGQEIPLWARIFSVVDALDAITAERPYRPARSYESALEEIRSHAGTQFDPAVVEALRCLDPARIEPLLEPGQQLDRAPEAALAESVALGPLLPA
jgi:ribonuclease P protein subunit RPR2